MRVAPHPLLVYKGIYAGLCPRPILVGHRVASLHPHTVQTCLPLTALLRPHPSPIPSTGPLSPLSLLVACTIDEGAPIRVTPHLLLVYRGTDATLCPEPTLVRHCVASSHLHTVQTCLPLTAILRPRPTPSCGLPCPFPSTGPLSPLSLLHTKLTRNEKTSAAGLEFLHQARACSAVHRPVNCTMWVIAFFPVCQLR